MVNDLFLVLTDSDSDQALATLLMHRMARNFAGLPPRRGAIKLWTRWNAPEPDEVGASLETIDRLGSGTSNRPKWSYVVSFLEEHLRQPIVVLIFVTRDFLRHSAVSGVLEKIKDLGVVALPIVLDRSLVDPPAGSEQPHRLLASWAVLDVSRDAAPLQVEKISATFVDLYFESCRVRAGIELEEPAAGYPVPAPSLATTRPLFERVAATIGELVTPQVQVVLGPGRVVFPPKVWQRPRGPMVQGLGAAPSLRAWLRRTRPIRAFRDAWRKAAGDGCEWVDGTVFAPPFVGRGERFMLQVIFHLPAQFKAAAEQAREADPAAGRRQSATLAMKLPHEALLVVYLDLPGLEVGARVQTAVWLGTPQPATFAVSVPPDQPLGNVVGVASVSYNDTPIGTITFQITVAEGEPLRAALVPTGTPRSFRYAFISYASPDRPEVLKRVQVLKLLGIGYFQDVLTLDPGDRWEKKLYEEIDACDLFLLFWSTSARDSPWVMNELGYAVDRKHGDEATPPQIYPVIVEGPPVPNPPPRLEQYHFNDALIYFLAAAELEKSRKARATAAAEGPASGN